MITTHPRRVGRFGLVELLESRQLLAAAPFTVGAMPELSAGAQWHQYAQLHPIDKPDSVGPDSGGAPQSRAPGLASTIEGITFDENGANNSGLLYIPSNPSGAAATPRNFSQGDFDYNSTVNLLDFNILAARFGMSAAPQASSAPRGTTSTGPGMFSNLRIGDASVDDELFGLLN